LEAGILNLASPALLIVAAPTILGSLHREQCGSGPAKWSRRPALPVWKKEKENKKKK
jgi:hypothetical protein